MIIPIDKPAGMTSHDVVAAVKRAVADRKLKIGHTGTLDPMCTGVLPVLTGADTKLSDLLVSDKQYLAGIRLGITTDTEDTTGQILSEYPVRVDRAQLEQVLNTFIGRSLQTPPMYSAVKHGGKKLYELARAGVEVERKPRPIEIYSLTVCEQVSDCEFLFQVDCSKGTYIRTLCADIGKKLGCGAAMSRLQRTRSNGFCLASCHSLDAVVEAAGQGRLKELSVSAEQAFSHCPRVEIAQSGLAYFLNGGVINYERVRGENFVGSALMRAYSESGNFVALCRGQSDGVKAVWKAPAEL